MVDDTMSRKWQITINNPVDKGFTHEEICRLLADFKSLVYYCISDEVGEAGTYHTHIYIACSSAVRFSTIKRKFDGGHFEMARGTSQQNRDYVFKEGKWKDTEKGTTNLADTHIEWGDMPVERQGKRNDLDDLYDLIYAGKTISEILEISPQYVLDVGKLEKARSIYLNDLYKSKRRDVRVTYVSGVTGCGKTRDIMDFWGDENVYRVTDYSHPFDMYDCEDVIVFEEFRSSLRLGDMLNYLDVYPLKLPARYAQRQACYKYVYIVSNQELEEQYEDIQKNKPHDYAAFLRRINYVDVYTSADVYTYTLSQYMSGFRPCVLSSFDKIKDVYIR